MWAVEMWGQVSEEWLGVRAFETEEEAATAMVECKFEYPNLRCRIREVKD